MKKVNLSWEKISNSKHIGNSCFQFDIDYRKNRKKFWDDSTDVTGLVNNAFAHLFKEGYIGITGGS